MSDQTGYVAIRMMTLPEYRAWSNGLGREARLQRIAETGHTALVAYGNGTFGWVCPSCGGFAAGTFGPEPVSGWTEPRWTREGDAEHLTLMPSLGCPQWRDGLCNGHWWCRDGRLVLA